MGPGGESISRPHSRDTEGGRKVTLAGVAFDVDMRNISDRPGSDRVEDRGASLSFP